MAVASMQEGEAGVGKGTKEAARSGAALKEILASITKVSGEINQIAMACEEETATTNEIAGSSNNSSCNSDLRMHRRDRVDLQIL